MKTLLCLLVVMLLCCSVVSATEIKVVVCMFFNSLGEESDAIPVYDFDRRLPAKAPHQKLKDLVARGWKVVHIEKDIASGNPIHVITLQKD